MFRGIIIGIALVYALPSPGMCHEIHAGAAATKEPYAPYAFLIGDWQVGAAGGGAPMATLKFHWATNRAYILYGAYIGTQPHFEGMLLWNGVHHNLDSLIAEDMEHGLSQERGTVVLVDGVAVLESVRSNSPGTSAGGRLAGPGGSTERLRQTMKPIDADHIALAFETGDGKGWHPATPGSDHLLMTRVP